MQLYVVRQRVKKKTKKPKKEGRKSRFQKMFWFGMMGLGRLIRSVINSRRKRNYKKSKDLIERKTKQKKDKKKIIPPYLLLRLSGVQLKGLKPRIFQTTSFGIESNEMYDIQNGST